LAEIVPFRAEHAPGFRELVVASLAEFGFGEDPAIDSDLADPAGAYDAVWIVVEDGHVAGSAALRTVSPGVAELKRMYLAPALRGRGLGGALLGEALSWARGRGVRRVVLDTADGMSAAQRFYERAGFRRVGDRWEIGDNERRHEILYAVELDQKVPHP
jgi:GNAT superfamily N-acetyltransferase